MVYENLTISTKQLRLLPREDGIQVERAPTGSYNDQPAITVTLQTLPVQIFPTSRLIYSEALPFLTPKLDKMRSTIPRISIAADYLSTNTPAATQNLLRAVLDNIEQHPFSSHVAATVCSPPTKNQPLARYPNQVHQWLAQTTHLLLSQRPLPCPFAGFMGSRTYPTVRLIIEVPKPWTYTTYHGLAAGAHTHSGTPPMYTGSIATQVSEVYGGLVEYTKGLRHVKSGGMVFGQEDETVLMEEGVVVTKKVAFDFGICRVVE